MENQEANTENYKLEDLKSKALKEIDFYFLSEENIKNNRFAPSMIVNAYGDFGKNEALKQKIINEHEKFTEIFADVVSSIENPNCSCRGRFASFIAENQEKTIAAYKSIINLIDEDSKSTLKEVLDRQNNFYKNYKENQEKQQSTVQTFSAPLSDFKNVNVSKNNQDSAQLNEKSFEKPKVLSSPFPVYLEGNVIEIEDSAVAYGELIKGLRESGEHYRGINLLQKPNNKIWVYFY